jgi:cytochrome c553
MKKRQMLAVLLFLGSAYAAFAATAQTTWDDQCAKCHGADGKGETKMGKKLSIRDFTDAKVQADFTDEQAFKAIKEGLTDKNGKTSMKAIEGLSDEDMKGMVAFVRTLKK